MTWLLEGVTSRHFGWVRIPLEAFFSEPKFGIINYRSPLIAEISEILFLGSNRFGDFWIQMGKRLSISYMP